MKYKTGILLILMGVLFGCAHIEGTRDKSSTIQRSPLVGKIESIAILPIKSYAGMPSLSSKVEMELQQSLQSVFPTANIVNVQTVTSKLAEHNLISTYGQWRASYESTSILDPMSLDALSRATGSQYFLLIHSPYLARERVRGADTGYTGLVNDANNVWRTDLRLYAELIDMSLKKIVWKGEGHAEHIHSPKKDHDYFFVIVHDRNPEISEYVGPMITTATQGLALQIAASQREK